MEQHIGNIRRQRILQQVFAFQTLAQTTTGAFFQLLPIRKTSVMSGDQVSKDAARQPQSVDGMDGASGGVIDPAKLSFYMSLLTIITTDCANVSLELP